MISQYIRVLGQELKGQRLAIWSGASEAKQEHECEVYRQKWLAEAEAKIIAGSQGRSLLCETRLRNLIRCVRATMHLDRPMAELGTYKGGSAWCLSRADPARALYCIDTWDGHPVDESLSGGHRLGDFCFPQTDAAAFLEGCNVQLIKGRFPETCGDLPLPYSLIHLDCDHLTYDMLRWWWDRLAEGGILIVDDYDRVECPTVKPAVDRLAGELRLSTYTEETQVVIQKEKLYHAPAVVKGLKKEILIEQRLSPGDMLGGVVPLVESIHRQFPGEYLTDVEGTCREAIFNGSPHVTRLRSPDKRVYAHYSVNGNDSRAFSFAQAHCDHFSDVMQLPTRLINQTRKPTIYLSDAEKERLPGLPERYAVMTAGYKADCDIKGKGSHLFWRDMVECCLAHGVEVLQVGERNREHIHQPIPGAKYMVGKTTMRGLFRLVNHAVCTLSSISLLTHISAAFDAPNLCLSSRESNDFAMYRTTISLNCVGILPCASRGSTGGCWKNSLEKFGKDGKLTSDSCALPLVQEDGSKAPACTDIVRKSGVGQAHLKKIFRAKGIL